MYACGMGFVSKNVMVNVKELVIMFVTVLYIRLVLKVSGFRAEFFWFFAVLVE